MENQNNENIISRSIISVGKYEILYRSYPVKAETDSDIAIQYLNNARVVTDAQLSYEIIPSDSEKSIRSVKFTIPSDDNKLSDVFENLPWGIIKKNRTGVGAHLRD